MFISFARIIKFAFQNFKRNFWLSVITVSILILSVLSFNTLVVLNFMAREAVRSIENRLDVSVYFKPNVSQDLVRSVRSYLLSFPQVSDVKLIDPAQALQNFTANNNGDKEILEAVKEIGENPFGSTLVVQAASTADYSLILQALEQPAYREFIEAKNFDDHRLLINSVTAFSEKAQKFGIAVSAIFVLIAALIVFNSIRVAIYTHREEIAIMKLVGASSAFVRLPFLLEGIIYSILAISVSAALVFFAAHAVDPILASFFDGADISVARYFRASFVPIFSGQLAALSFLTMLSSAVAMRRYLRV